MSGSKGPTSKDGKLTKGAALKRWLLMRIFNDAWEILKDDMAEEKKKIIQCLKDEDGAAGLDCCEARGLSKEKCKAVLKTINIKMHKYGDVILMDGL